MSTRIARFERTILLLGLGAAGCAAGPQATRSTAAAPPAGAVAAAKPATAPAAAPVPTTASLRMQADQALAEHRYADCGRLLDQAAALARRDRGLTAINAACCWALGADPNHAFASLDHALTDGFRRPQSMQNDSDLTALHGDSRWPDVLARAQRNADDYVKDANPTLLHLYQEDQADRSGDPAHIDWKRVTPRDVARQARVRQIVDAGGAKTAADYYHAAMVFQHCREADEIALAHKLVLRAVELDRTDPDALWLAAATQDRWLMKQGKPQLYGTQMVRSDGRWVVYQVDPTITDAERDRWAVPSLAEAYKQAEQLNARH